MQICLAVSSEQAVFLLTFIILKCCFLSISALAEDVSSQSSAYVLITISQIPFNPLLIQNISVLAISAYQPLITKLFVFFAFWQLAVVLFVNHRACKEDFSYISTATETLIECKELVISNFIDNRHLSVCWASRPCCSCSVCKSARGLATKDPWPLLYPLGK